MHALGPVHKLTDEIDLTISKLLLDFVHTCVIVLEDLVELKNLVKNP